jgi:hypothetical protein
LLKTELGLEIQILFDNKAVRIRPSAYTVMSFSSGRYELQIAWGPIFRMRLTKLLNQFPFQIIQNIGSRPGLEVTFPHIALQKIT